MSIDATLNQFIASVDALAAAINRQTDVLISATGAQPAARPKKASTAPAPAAEAPAAEGIDMQTLTKAAVDLVKASGGKRDRLIALMKEVNPAYTAIPTIAPADYAAVYEKIQTVLVTG